MNRSDFKKAYEFSIKGVVAKLTLAMSVLSAVRFFVDVYKLPLNTVLAGLLETYQAVFHTCVDILLIWMPYKLPAWGKDLAIFYFLFAFIHFRVLYRQAEVNYRHPWIIQHNYGNSKVTFVLKHALELLKASLLWPLKTRSLFSKPYLAVASGAHGPSALYFSHDRPMEGGWQGAYLGDARLMMLVRLTAILLGALVVLVLNYAF